MSQITFVAIRLNKYFNFSFWMNTLHSQQSYCMLYRFNWVHLNPKKCVHSLEIHIEKKKDKTSFFSIVKLSRKLSDSFKVFWYVEKQVEDQFYVSMYYVCTLAYVFQVRPFVDNCLWRKSDSLPTKKVFKAERVKNYNPIQL